MDESKLGQMLKLLTVEEAENFLRTLDPHSNEVSRAVVRLAHMLVPQRSHLPSKAEVWERLLPGLPYDDLALRRLMSDLLACLAGFIQATQAAQAGLQPQLQLLRALRQREAAGLYEFYARKIERQAQALPRPLESDTLLDAYLHEAERNAWLERSAHRSGITNLDASVAALDRFYLFNKLKYACTRLNNSNVMGQVSQDPLLEGLLRQLPDSPFAQDPAILIYFRIYQMLGHPDADAHYTVLRGMLAAHATAFAQEEARHLYAFAMNYCIGRINAGEGSYLREIFGLYQEALARQALLVGGSLSPWDYKNIVVVGLRLAEWDWVEAFIHDFKPLIPAEQRENAFTYNLAKLHFYRRDHSKVLLLLRQVEYEDVFYNLDAKTMLLKIFYEQHEIEALDSLIESFRNYLRRNKLISERHRDNYLNLTRFVKKLSRVRRGDRKRLAQIRADLEVVRNIADVDWLREKLGS